MPISALVLTMNREDSSRERGISELRRDGRLTLGELQEVQLPVVVETKTVSESIEIVREELPAIEGVQFVHVISVDFSDLESRDERLPRRNKKRTFAGGNR